VEQELTVAVVASPSAQVRIEPDGAAVVLSTHDQLLTGALGHTYDGCRFPARAAYAGQIAEDALAVARQLAGEGAVGRLGVDFVAVADGEDGPWTIRAVEVNLREGATTHPLAVLDLLTDGAYDPATARYRTAAGHERAYRATDGLRAAAYRGLAPHTVVAGLADAGLAWDPQTETGVIVLMLRALATEGRLSATVVGTSREDAEDRYARLVALLDELAQDAEARRPPVSGSDR
jgi:hypothetical protein